MSCYWKKRSNTWLQTTELKSRPPPRSSPTSEALNLTWTRQQQRLCLRFLKFCCLLIKSHSKTDGEFPALNNEGLQTQTSTTWRLDRLSLSLQVDISGRKTVLHYQTKVLFILLLLFAKHFNSSVSEQSSLNISTSRSRINSLWCHAKLKRFSVTITACSLSPPTASHMAFIISASASPAPSSSSAGREWREASPGTFVYPSNKT